VIMRALSGREIDVHEVLKFLYGLSESDVRVLHYLLENGKAITIEELSKNLNVSKASVSKSLKNLYEMGLVKKEKLVEKESRKGRPSYLYKVDVGELYEKVVGDLEELLGATRIQLKVHFKLGDTTGIKEEKAKAA